MVIFGKRLDHDFIAQWQARRARSSLVKLLCPSTGVLLINQGPEWTPPCLHSTSKIIKSGNSGAAGANGSGMLTKCRREKSATTSCDTNNLPPRHIPANEIGGPKSVVVRGLILCLSLATTSPLTDEAEARARVSRPAVSDVLPTCTYMQNDCGSFPISLEA